jgi:hypothetical protein
MWDAAQKMWQLSAPLPGVHDFAITVGSLKAFV